MFDDKIKVVAFDLDNTLYDQDEYYLQVIETFSKAKNLEATALIEAFQKVKDSSRDIFGDILKEINLYSVSYQNDFFDIYRTIDARVDMLPSAKEVLQYLIDNNIRRGIITNGVIEVQKNKVKSLHIESYFDLIVYARTWGKDFEKPHIRPFKFLLDHFRCKPEEVLFFGDKHDIDILGACNAGMKCELVEKNADFLKIVNKYQNYE